MGNLPWQEVFRDPYLQSLIAQGLEHNLDLQTARLRVQEAEASLQARTALLRAVVQPQSERCAFVV